MDEKEVYVIKSCDMRKPCYNVLALQQAAEADAQGLHNSLKAAVAKVEFILTEQCVLLVWDQMTQTLTKHFIV